MSLISKMRRQRAWLWVKQTSTDLHGNHGFDSPIKITCRWEDGEAKIITPNGTESLVQATVYVENKLQVGDLLQLEPDVGNEVPPDETPTDLRVVATKSIPNLKNTETLQIAYLGRA
jgi:hypothetical protein